MTKVCKECGNVLGASSKPRMFCSTPCRQTFNNRRLERGAQLYDLFMAMRYERGTAKVLGVWAVICRLAKDFREEDELQRDGRKSWQPASAIFERLPVVMTSKNVTITVDRTGRRGVSARPFAQ